MAILENGGYLQSWYHCEVNYNEGYQSVMMDFHAHPYYEVSLILTGNVQSLLKDRSAEGTQSRLVLTAPKTPHWMRLSAPSFYSRINLYFSNEFIEDYVPEWRSLSRVFGKNGNILLLSDEQRTLCREQLMALQGESDPFRQRLRILAFLSYVSEFDPHPTGENETPPPAYIIEALSYIGEHYSERIVAHELAWKLGVCRTTLMTAFRKHTGTTLSEYIIRVRVKEAIRLLGQGISQERIAEQVGFGNGGGLIRAFRHCYGMTPRQYMKAKRETDAER